MGLLDDVRSRAHAALLRAPGRVGDRLRAANDALGRPLADAGELEERRAFAERGAPSRSPAPSTSTGKREAPPIIVYHMDKTRRDAQRLVDMLEAHEVPHRVLNIQEDPAAQMAVRRDSKGFRLPVVFVAGEAIGGRTELATLLAAGTLTRK